ncbi:MAG TPA: hypothetical protein VN861_17690 [Candidatus Acidoferrales bacterium]|nr:hypothetical protein [Candidatus Acidoferrales bacterium]
MLQAEFDDLAITNLLLRSVSKEGRWFPSPAKILNQVFPVGREFAVLNPVTGKGVRYTRREDKPVQWESLW